MNITFLRETKYGLKKEDISNINIEEIKTKILNKVDCQHSWGGGGGGSELYKMFKEDFIANFRSDNFICVMNKQLQYNDSLENETMKKVACFAIKERKKKKLWQKNNFLH